MLELLGDEGASAPSTMIDQHQQKVTNTVQSRDEQPIAAAVATSSDAAHAAAAAFLDLDPSEVERAFASATTGSSASSQNDAHHDDAGGAAMHSSPSLFDSFAHEGDDAMFASFASFDEQPQEQAEVEESTTMKQSARSLSSSSATSDSSTSSAQQQQQALLMASAMIPTIDDMDADDRASPSADDDDVMMLLSSTTSTLLSSFTTTHGTTNNTPALGYLSTATRSSSDFDGSPELELAALAAGEMALFPPPAANKDQKNALASSSSSAYGCEPAFDDVDLETLRAHGLFSLPLFGGLPAATAAATQPQQSQQQTDASMTASPAAISRKVSFTEEATIKDAANMNPASLAAMSPLPAAAASPAFMHAASPQDVLGTPTMLRRMPSSPALPVVDDIAPITAAEQQPSAAGKTKKTAAARRSKPYEPTGTRTSASSRTLLGADAPTMTKTYAAPGKTTKKAIPVGFQKRLGLTGAADAHGDVALPSDDPAARELMDEIEEKRRKNCLAARESRRRKQEHLQGLKDEITQWREWAAVVERELKQSGLSGLLEGFGPMPASMDLDEQ